MRDENDDRFPERVALLARVLDRAPDDGPLEGLAEPARARALRAAERFRHLCPEDRRGLLARELGSRPDADARVRAVVAAAPPDLRVALYRVLPAYARALFPELRASAGAHRPPPRPHLKALARRRAREAMR